MKELSHNRFKNRMNERELDVFELEERINYSSIYDEFHDLIGVDLTPIDNYGTYEDLSYSNCYGVEEVYSTYDEEWN